MNHSRLLLSHTHALTCHHQDVGQARPLQQVPQAQRGVPHPAWPLVPRARHLPHQAGEVKALAREAHAPAVVQLAAFLEWQRA